MAGHEVGPTHRLAGGVDRHGIHLQVKLLDDGHQRNGVGIDHIAHLFRDSWGYYTCRENEYQPISKKTQKNVKKCLLFWGKSDIIS